MGAVALHCRDNDGAHVVVVGGGLAGMVAATVLADRGLRVTVCEAGDRIGGRLAAWAHRHRDGSSTTIDHGFHAFFAQYHNLRAFLRRVDPGLDGLRPLPSYPIVAAGRPDEELRSSRGPLPVKMLALLMRSPSLRLRDLRHADGRVAATLLSYDRSRTYTAYDGISAATLIAALGLPEKVRTTFLEVFARSAFDTAETLSAAEFVAMLHFYFLGHPAGLRIDEAVHDYASWLWQPLVERLARRNGEVRTASPVESVERRAADWLVHLRGGERLPATHVVIAADVDGARALVARSPSLAAHAPRLASDVAALTVAPPFAVARYWLARNPLAHRPAFAVVAGPPGLDVIARRSDDLLELQAYDVGDGAPAAVADRMLDALRRIWPELGPAAVTESECAVHRTASSFPVGGDVHRPGVHTDAPHLYVAGDWVRLPFPAALMERAATTGVLAANGVLATVGAPAEPVESVRARGVLAGSRFAAYPDLSRR